MHLENVFSCHVLEHVTPDSPIAPCHVLEHVTPDSPISRRYAAGAEAAGSLAVSGPGFDQWGYNQQVVTLSIAVYRGRPGGGGEAGGAEGGEVAGVLAAEWLATDWDVATLGSVDECTASGSWCLLVDQVRIMTTSPCGALVQNKSGSKALGNLPL